jgi:monoamine oxidase
MLNGVSVIVAGAGLAGLSAGWELARRGANIRIFEARDRVGGRVWTLRDGLAGAQHGELGGDLIDEEQTEILDLARHLGLSAAEILQGGFGYYRRDTARHEPAGGGAAWQFIAGRLRAATRAYTLAEMRWDSPIAHAIHRFTVAEWLEQIEAPEEVRGTMLGLRGFFLADPTELSLLALIDQVASSGNPGLGRTYRIQGGNDRIPGALHGRLGDRVVLGSEVVGASQTAGHVQVSLRDRHGERQQVTADYVVLALPATLVRHLVLEPSLPDPQRCAIDRLRYGCATKTVLQFDRPFWRWRDRPRAYGTDLPIGAVWDGSEEQTGAAAVLTLLAGGSASQATRQLLANSGVNGLCRQLEWLGVDRARILACRSVSWEEDAWARGGYAYFHPGYDPAWRAWLPRAFGRVIFAGEHTSFRWQGYMNGAVESGLRAAAEVQALARGDQLASWR